MKIQSLPDVEAVFIDDKKNNAEYLKQFSQIEATGWKKEHGTPIISNKSVKKFHEEMVSRLSDSGWIRWHFLKSEDKIIAGHFGFCIGRKFTLYKIAYDASYASFSPGTILFERMLEHFYATREVDEINCLSDYQWQRSWKMELNPYYHAIISFRKPASLILSGIPSLAYALYEHSSLLRKLYKIFRNLSK